MTQIIKKASQFGTVPTLRELARRLDLKTAGMIDEHLHLVATEAIVTLTLKHEKMIDAAHDVDACNFAARQMAEKTRARLDREGREVYRHAVDLLSRAQA